LMPSCVRYSRAEFVATMFRRDEPCCVGSCDFE
jgi:hypothetical protein